jgi:RecA-family ATPase
MKNFTTENQIKQENSIDADAIRAEFEIFSAETAQTAETEDETNDFEKIGFTYGELIKLELPPREEIIFGLGRGEVGLFNAVNNAGKTTVLRNLMISLGIGKPFLPFGNFSLPKRVAFLDFEDTLSFLRRDLSVMLTNFSDLEKSRFNDNALLICEYADGQGEDLSLSKLNHLAVLTENLIKFAPDLIIVDTISSAFQIRDENNNAEVRKFIMRPLKQLAKDVGAAVIATHHIGKPKAEEGQAKEASFRGRGASSFADMARLVLNLEKDSVDETVALICAKVKGAKFTDLKLKLNTETRWFESQGECREITNYSLLLEMFADGREYSTKEVVDEFNGVMSVRNTKSYLNKAVENKDLKKVRHGIYQADWQKD